MNLTALTLLQGRLFDIACESGARLQRLRQERAGEGVAGTEPGWSEAGQQLRSETVAFFERRLSTALYALDRIDEGRFGWCESCGEQIGGVQLFVHPLRSTCTSCEQTAEGR
jgi:RNA polymerase-binding transcription factor DksA